MEEPITWRVTKNNRKLFEGVCVECDGKLALMSGYATLTQEENED